MGPICESAAHENCILEIIGPWKTTCSRAEEYPDFTPIPELDSLGDWSLSESLTHFAGTVRYETAVNLPGDWARDRPAVLDLGEGFELARVRVNGQEAGVRIAPPYRFALTGLLGPGENRLEIEVTNTLVRSSPTPDPFSRYAALEPCGLLGPVRMLGEMPRG